MLKFLNTLLEVGDSSQSCTPRGWGWSSKFLLKSEEFAGAGETDSIFKVKDSETTDQLRSGRKERANSEGIWGELMKRPYIVIGANLKETTGDT